jgi:hypothetical protein
VLFAHPDVVKAHDEMVGKQKVNFEDVSKSHVVRQLEANHNCPIEGCDAAIDELVPALQEWADALQKQDEEKDGLPLTTVMRLSDAESSTVSGGNPPGVLMLEAEAGVIKAPMRLVDSGTASGGKIVDTPAGAGTQNNVANATASNALGTMIYTFEAKEAGTYRVHGLVNGPTAANNGFWIRMDGGALQGWLFPANADAYGWDLADPVEAVGNPIQFTLTAGLHTFEIRQRREQAKWDKIVLSNDPMFNPAQAQPAERQVNLLTYDISEQTGIEGAQFTVEVSDYSVNAYMFKNPSIVLPTGSVQVKNVKLLINGVFLPEHATYTIVDKTVAAPGGSLTSAALIALKDKGPEADEFSFSFDVLKEAP